MLRKDNLGISISLHHDQINGVSVVTMKGLWPLPLFERIATVFHCSLTESR